jgi:hypothetical protein
LVVNSYHEEAKRATTSTQHTSHVHHHDHHSEKIVVVVKIEEEEETKSIANEASKSTHDSRVGKKKKARTSNQTPLYRNTNWKITASNRFRRPFTYVSPFRY